MSALARTTACWAVLLLVTPAVGATTMTRLSDAELAAGAQLIVDGVCRSTETVRRGRHLYTLARVRVDRALKGSPPDEITVVLPGGVDRDAPVPVAEVWPGSPTLVAGERALLFLRPVPSTHRTAATWSIVGFSQGKFSLATGPAGQRAVRDLGGTTLVGDDGGTRPGQRRDEALEALLRRLGLAPGPGVESFAPPTAPGDEEPR